MRGAGRRLVPVAVLATVLAPLCVAGAADPYEQRTAVSRAYYTGVAIVANVVPVVSTIYASRCLPGYVMCKAMWAGISVVAAADQLAWSGGGDMAQTRAILYRGFAGDWYLTGRHTSGDREPQPLPEPPAPPSDGGGKWEPPPL